MPVSFAGCVVNRNRFFIVMRACFAAVARRSDCESRAWHPTMFKKVPLQQLFQRFFVLFLFSTFSTHPITAALRCAGRPPEEEIDGEDSAHLTVAGRGAPRGGGRGPPPVPAALTGGERSQSGNGNSMKRVKPLTPLVLDSSPTALTAGCGLRLPVRQLLLQCLCCSVRGCLNHGMWHV